MKFGAKHRLLSILASFSLLVNSFAAPISALAQEATSEPTPVVEETPTPTVEATPSPTTEVTEDASVEASTTELVQETTATETALSLPEPDLSSPQEETSAQLNPTLTTDKADYAPSETVTITGKDFPKSSNLTIRVTWPDGVVISSAGVVNGIDTVTTNDIGTFVFFYDLRGEGQEGEYLVEILMGTTILSTVTFRDSHISSHLCSTDTAGANDEPGQKDLTQMCADYSGLNTSIGIDWNWDDTEWPGQNTGDACALFDNNGNGLAEYASCVTVQGKPATQASNSPRLYTCNDSRGDRCAGATLITGSYSTSCGVNQSTDQPFGAGSDSPNDTKATCNIILSEVGGENDTQLLDVCSFPSEQPNSDPSDCIIARTRAGKLEVKKALVPDTDAGLFNLLVDGLVRGSDVGDGGTTGELSLDEGEHSFSETAGTGTDLSSYTQTTECRDLNGTGNLVSTTGTGAGPYSINIPDESDIVCVITNTLATGTLRVIKNVTNDNGGQATASAFTLHVQDGGVDVSGSPAAGSSTGTVYTLQAGSYEVSEDTPPTGYSQTGFSGHCDQSGNVTVVAGQEKTCTIINDDNAPSLTLVKDVIIDNGGTAVESNWTLTATGPTGFSGSGPSVSNGASFDAGTYDLSESGPSGYSPSDWVCVGGSQSDGDTIEIGLGEDVTCTITNDDNSPSLTLVKVVTNNSGGGAYAALWTLTATGLTGFSGAGPSVSNGLSFNAGTYTLSESGGPSGYEASAWVCTGDGNQNGNQITLGLGDSATCTITNDDIAPTLKLLKSVTKDNGGTALPGDWTLYATGEEGFSDLGDSTTFHTVLAGLDGYVLSESAIAGYAAGTWSCTGGDLNGDTLILGLADQITCTIINDDIAPSLTLNKVLITDNGGTASESDWTLTADGPTPLSGAGAAGSTDVVSGSDFSAGTYTLSESGPAGYSDGGWNCTGGTQNGNQITVALGQSVTCTITNDDIGPLLMVIKEVVGGSADVEDFNLYVGFTQVTSGDQNGFDVGSYVVSEDNLEGYISEISGDCDSEGNVTLELGDEKTCTITNSLVSLSSVKSNIGPSEVLVGETATFQAVIENTGEVTLYNPIVFDIFDTDYVDFDSSSPIDPSLVLDDIGADFGDYDEDGDTSEHIGLLGWEVPVDLAPGETYTITLYFIATAVTPDSEEVVSTNGIVTLVCLEDTEECSEGDTLETEISYASVDIDDIGISIEKSNDKPSALAGDTVTYTLVVTNNGESLVFDVEVTDSLPGGFTYVSGSTIINGSPEADPSISGNNLTWNVETVIPGEPVTIVYQATIASDITSGTYTNLATCEGVGGFFDQIELFIDQEIDGEFEGEIIECNVADSSVGIGRGTDFGGNIPPQVLGAATELPAAGSDTALLALAIMALIAGVSLKGTAFVLTHAKPKRRKYAKN